MEALVTLPDAELVSDECLRYLKDRVSKEERPNWLAKPVSLGRTRSEGPADPTYPTIWAIHKPSFTSALKDFAARVKLTNPELDFFPPSPRRSRSPESPENHRRLSSQSTYHAFWPHQSDQI